MHADWSKQRMGRGIAFRNKVHAQQPPTTCNIPEAWYAARAWPGREISNALYAAVVHMPIVTPFETVHMPD